MIRYYESIGLIPEARRTEAGYRDYSDKDVQTLRFIRRARALGFSVEHVAELERKAKELQEMSQALKHLAKNCQGDTRPDCPIISGLAEDGEGKRERGSKRQLPPPRFGATGIEPRRKQRREDEKG